MVGKLLARLPENNRLERIWKIAQVDFKRRYYNDRLGLLWALLKPLFEVFVYYFVFKFVFKIEMEHFAFFLFSGIVFMNIFTESSLRGINLIREKLYLIENIQFQRIDIFVSHIISVFFGFSFNISALVIVMLVSRIPLSWEIWYILPVFLIFYVISLGASLILASLQPLLKDIVHVWDMTILLLIWSSGVFYPPTAVTDDYPWMAFINPFLGLMQNLRGALLPNYEVIDWMLWVNLGQALLILVLGRFIFERFGALAVEKL